ncbi:hypothetical protein JAU75_17275 [Ochrobactrum sp. Q0168]|uniref:hypothetical protein n=1 Tax=Ochrobactrum sp. Q0168 TaxID=2793241 RepID=UPI0018EC888F|nr:hypothetical protein [Ochrobactrum sp. Q0168]
MKKFALAALAVALSAGAAYAENPYVGMPDSQVVQEKAFKAPNTAPLIGTSGPVDYTSTATIRQSTPVYQDGSANRFGDASPSSYEN